MNNILFLLSKYAAFIVLMLLEVINLSILFNNHEFHEAAYINQANHFTNSIQEKVSNTKAYFNLTHVNDSITRFNASLLQRIYNAAPPTIPIPNDTIGSLTILNQYQFIPARVINNSTSSSRNYIYINRGTADGVEKDMGVINENGPVGVVVNSTEHYAVIMSFLHKQSFISAKVKNTNYFGELSWDGKSNKIADLKEIPKHVKVRKGDTIITSGHSSYFPENIDIGIISKFVNESQNRYAEAQVILFNDFSNLNYVYVIKNAEQKNIQALEKIEESLNKDQDE